MPHPVNGIVAASAAGIVAAAAIPLFAQTSASLLQGKATFGDWRTDHPGDASADQAATLAGTRFGRVGTECRPGCAPDQRSEANRPKWLPSQPFCR
jgi:hypothetical protein